MDRNEAVEAARRDAAAGFGHLMRVAAELDRLVDRALQQEAGISHVMFEVLLRLYRCPQTTMPIHSLKLSLTSGGMTRLLDRMTAAGLVERVRHPSDRRVWLVRPTAESEATFLRASEVHRRVVERYFVAPLTSTEQTELTRCLARLEDIVTDVTP